MERGLLDSYLREGLSLEAIAARVGLDRSTVGYWVRRHGLRAVHRDRHAKRGALSRATLQALVDDGLSTREMATKLDRSQSTIRHWLRRHDLQTARALRRRIAGEAMRLGVTSLEARCHRHALTEHAVRVGHGLICLRCRSEAVARRRREIKRILVTEAGGACRVCGYSQAPAALAFHHLDPTTKSFSIAEAGMTRSLERARREARKCVLLCANCHAEVEAGLIAPNFSGVARSGVAQLADALGC